jgi:phenylpyruvate tautomerase PptA (4-oxalocrotonate tautomerase family)
MPLWNIWHSPNTLNDKEKELIASQITAMYTSAGLPAFYVNVFFHPLPPSDLYIGGKPRSNFLRAMVQHIALRFEDRKDPVELQKRFLSATDRILAPICKKYGLDWEYHILETPRELWKINGLVPPPFGSSEEKEWFTTNKTSRKSEKL